MRLVEFLIQILEAHAQTLLRLSALLGEERLVKMLDDTDEYADRRASELTIAGLRAPGVALDAPSTEAVVNESAAVTGGQRFVASAIEQFLPPADPGDSDAYAELEEAIAALDLPPLLEAHLWSYPTYRGYIEGPIDLDSRIPGSGGDLGPQLVEDAVQSASDWIREMAFAYVDQEDLELRERVEDTSHLPWLRFRTTVLKRIGRRPLGPVA